MSSKLFSKLAMGTVLALCAASAVAGQIMLYEGPGFRGRSAVTTGAIPDLGNTVLAGTASSLVVTDGIWEACTDTYFRGRCGQLVPGNYAGLSGNLGGAILSVRQIQSVSAIQIVPDTVPVIAVPAQVVTPAQVVVSQPPPAVVYPAPAPVVVNPPANPPSQAVAAVPDPATSVVQIAPRPNARAVLFQFPNFGGPRAVVEYRRMPDLDWANFRYPAASLRIESGRWVACTEMGYQGQCRVLEPGDYPALAGDLAPGIASMWPVA